MNPVLVDSSIWIAAAHPKNPECLKLKRLIKQNTPIYLIRAIQTEVCQGARTPEFFHRLWDSFLGFDFLTVTDQHWGKSAWNYFLTRKKGYTLSTLDCLIATVAAEYKIPLWSLDKKLLRAQSVIKFDIYRV
jgi:predicted nucleic acid-binding protein